MKQHLLIWILTAAAALTLADRSDIDAAFFHPAASLYIHGDTAGASNLVSRGLALYPEDGKLLRLKELLEQQQQEQQQEPQQEQQQEQQQNEQQGQDEPSQEEQQRQEEQDARESETEEQPQQTEPRSAEQMSPDEAEQLLDAMRQEEQNKRLQLHPVLGAPVNVEKDW